MLLLLLFWWLFCQELWSLVPKLTSPNFLNTGRRHDFWVRDRNQFFTQSNNNNQHNIKFASISWAHFLKSKKKKFRRHWHTQWVMHYKRRSSSSGNLHIWYGKQAWLVPQKETLPLSYCTANNLTLLLSLSSKTINYTNMFEKIIWNKGSQCFCRCTEMWKAHGELFQKDPSLACILSRLMVNFSMNICHFIDSSDKSYW